MTLCAGTYFTNCALILGSLNSAAAPSVNWTFYKPTAYMYVFVYISASLVAKEGEQRNT